MNPELIKTKSVVLGVNLTSCLTQPALPVLKTELSLQRTSDSDVDRVTGFSEVSLAPVHSSICGGEGSVDGARG